ncbi:MAG: hypothetical protein KAV87_23940 [Desulfobacteraceae bacterium]|nr:hypothetical protein [Desulfobacteraceae bacterium]
MLTNQTRASLVQLLQALSREAVFLLMLKHLDCELRSISAHNLLEAVSAAEPDQLAGLLVELVGGKTAIRNDAPTKYVFDGRLEDLASRLRADGYEVIEDALSRLMPAAEPVAQISDSLEKALATSALDHDGNVRKMLKESHQDLSGTPPDLNGATSKARISLETVARRAASLIATSRNTNAPKDTWGPALSFLRAQGVIEPQEEDALARIYTLISPGAHVPKGLSDEQWALLSRTFAVSGAYFLLQRFMAV